MTTAISRAVLALLAALVEERVGLSYRATDNDLFADKLWSRAVEAGFESALDYYYFLRYDADGARELQALVDSLVVTETYFFREADALAAAVEHVIAPRILAGGRARVWSAACASGDEPLTIAMMLDERGMLDRAEIVASDVSLRAVERAREHGWGARSTRGSAATHAARWLSIEDGRARVDPRLVAAVDWRRLNLLDRPSVASLGRFDLILCRNVLIYFADETIQTVVTSLADALAEGGRLLVGAAESLLRFGTMLECEERGGAFFYRKAAS